MDFDPSNPYQSNYELNEVVFNGLIEAFKKLYPDTYKKLEKISDGIDDKIKQDLSFANDPNHILCKGERKLIIDNQFQKLEQCIECKRYFSYRKSLNK